MIQAGTGDWLRAPAVRQSRAIHSSRTATLLNLQGRNLRLADGVGA
jgi:hypothetical protein